VPAALTEIITLGRTLTRRAAESWPTSTGPAPATDRRRPSTAGSNTSAAPPSGSATSPTTPPDHSWKPADSDPDYTLDCEEPRNRSPRYKPTGYRTRSLGNVSQTASARKFDARSRLSGDEASCPMSSTPRGLGGDSVRSRPAWRELSVRRHDHGTSNGVLVDFEKAAPRRFDLVVGADGLQSVTTQAGLRHSGTALHPQGILNAWFTIPAEIELDDWYLITTAPRGRVIPIRPANDRTEGALRPFDRRVRPGRHRWPDRPAGTSLRRWGLGGSPRLLRAARRAPDFYLDSMGQVQLDRWSQGRVVLLGDAGYCSSPLTGPGTAWR
jgi:FAD binding domain